MPEPNKGYPVVRTIATIGMVSTGLAIGLKGAAKETDKGQLKPLTVGTMPAEPEKSNAAAPKPTSDPTKPKQFKDPLAKSAMNLYIDFKHLPYVWGGESPLTYEETMDDPFFKGFYGQVTRKQPPGSFRSGKPTEPGFDCSGFLWYIGKKAGLQPFNDRRLTADGYKRLSRMVLKPGKHTADELKENDEEGYLLFKTRDNGRAYHVGICLGNGYVLECSGIEKPDYSGVPKSEWERWRSQYGKPDKMRGGLHISPIDSFAQYNTAIGDL